MSSYHTAQIMALKQAYPFQVTVKHWRRKCQDKELSYDAVNKLVERLRGTSWYQSRKSGHKVFGFTTRDNLEAFTKIVITVKETTDEAP